MHHGSISKELRFWVEDALYEGKLKAVVCTSSLDFGVDFRPVEAIVQIGGPKGVARFVQRAGRSGHQPGAESKIHFCPRSGWSCSRPQRCARPWKPVKSSRAAPWCAPLTCSCQFLCTLAVGDGFRAEALRERMLTTHAFSSMDEQEWSDVLADGDLRGAGFCGL